MRKRRLARLGGAKWTPHPSAPVDALLEKALGHELAETQREEISKLVADYLMFEGMERAAPFQSDEQAWLMELAAAAANYIEFLLFAQCTSKRRAKGSRKSRSCLPGSRATPLARPAFPSKMLLAF